MSQGSGPARVPGDTALWVAIDWESRTIDVLGAGQRLVTKIDSEGADLVLAALLRAEWTLEGVAGATPIAQVTADAQAGTIGFCGLVFSTVQSQELRRLLGVAQVSLRAGIGGL